jgi:hypothetical protein
MSKNKRFSISNFCAVSGAIILFGSEILAAAFAAAWALAGIFSLGDPGFYAFALVFACGAFYAIFAFSKQALKTEPVYF